MANLIDYDKEHGLLWISFGYDPSIINTVKSIRGRSYDGSTKRWSIPIAQIDEAIEKLEPLHFSFTPRLRAFWLEHRDSEPLQDQTPEDEVETPTAYSVSRLNEEARHAVTAHFTEMILLEAEVSGWDRNRSVGHAYFELVERVADGTDPIARIAAICFGSTRQRIAGKLRRLGVQIKDGQRIRFFVRPEIYPQGGKFQVVIQDVDTEFAVDQALKRRDVVLAKLHAANLTEKNLDLPLPICPLRIGLVTSPDTEAQADFMHELELSPFKFEVHFAPARMQGQEAGPSIVRAVEHLNSLDLDAVAIVRGGGAKLSLADLDTYEIAEVVCNSTHKVVCGIGHHRDRGVLDSIAMSEKTPTAAAQFLVRRVGAYLSGIEDLGQKVALRAVQRLHAARRTVEVAAHATERLSRAWLHASRVRLERVTRNVREVPSQLRIHRHQVYGLQARIAAASTRYTGAAGVQTERCKTRLVRVHFRRRFSSQRTALQTIKTSLRRRTSGTLQDEKEKLVRMTALVAALSPDKTVARGFAILNKSGGQIVTSVTHVEDGEQITARLQDGVVVLMVVNKTGD